MATKKKTAKKKVPAKKPAAKPSVKKIKTAPAKKAVSKKAVKKTVPKKVEKKSAVRKPAAPRKPAQAQPMKPIWEEPATSSPQIAAMPVEKKESSSKGIIILIALIVIAGILYFFFKPQISSLITREPAKISEPSVISTQNEAPTETLKKLENEEPVAQPVKKAEPVVKPVIDDDNYYYDVQPKDNLVDISQRLYGRYDRWREIYAANKDKITDPKVIHIGQKLLIPGMKK